MERNASIDLHLAYLKKVNIALILAIDLQYGNILFWVHLKVIFLLLCKESFPMENRERFLPWKNAIK